MATARREEVLFVSSRSRWEEGRRFEAACRFASPGLPVKQTIPGAGPRIRAYDAWTLESIVQAGDAVTVSMSTESNDNTKKWWPADFHLVHRATFGSELIMELEVRNTGAGHSGSRKHCTPISESDKSTRCGCRVCRHVDYVDKTDSNRKKTQQGSNRDHVGNRPRLPQHPGCNRIGRWRTAVVAISVAKENSLTTVVWNPWIEKAKALSDFGDDEWMKMICIEASNVADFAVVLSPASSTR